MFTNYQLLGKYPFYQINQSSYFYINPDLKVEILERKQVNKKTKLYLELVDLKENKKMFLSGLFPTSNTSIYKFDNKNISKVKSYFYLIKDKNMIEIVPG